MPQDVKLPSQGEQGLRINEGTGLLEICLPDLEQ